METENFTAIDLQKEYRSLTKAVRISCSLVLLLFSAWCGMQGLLSQAVMEGTVARRSLTWAQARYVPERSGGEVLGFIYEYGALSCAIPAAGAFIVFAFLWLASPKPSSSILLTAVAVTLCLLVGWIVSCTLPSRWPLQFIFP